MLSLILALSLHAAPLQAQSFLERACPHFSQGPTLPLYEFRPGLAHPLTLAAGAGYFGGCEYFDTEAFGSTFSLLDVQGAAFVNFVPGQSGPSLTSLAVAGLVCTWNNAVCAGLGTDVYTGGGLFRRTDGGPPWFGLLSIGLNFEFASSGITLTRRTAFAQQRLPRNNTIDFGAR